MEFSKYKKLEKQLETNSFELNFGTLDKTLYWFSFLGNIAIIYFSYYFFADVVDSIPDLAGIRATIFLAFAILIMTGYELFKRFAFEQFIVSIFKHKKVTAGIIGGAIAVASLTAGSFYLSLNGSHRWIDRSTQIATTIDQTVSTKADSIAKYYDKEIDFYRNQPARTRADRKYRDSIVTALEQTKESKIQAAENKVTGKSASKINEVQENSFAFAVMVFFLEFIILIGVAFSTYYQWTSYAEMKQLLTTPKYRQLEINLNLLKLYYQNGRKKEQDPTISRSKLIALTKAAKLNVSQTDINGFVALCNELEIVSGSRRKKVYNMSYEKAKTIIETNEN